MAEELLIRGVYRRTARSWTYNDADQADLSTKGLKVELLATRTSSTALVTLTVGSGITLDGSVTYRATFGFTSAQLDLTPGEYWFVITYTSIPDVAAEGPFVISAPRGGAA